MREQLTAELWDEMKLAPRSPSKPSKPKPFKASDYEYVRQIKHVRYNGLMDAFNINPISYEEFDPEVGDR